MAVELTWSQQRDPSDHIDIRPVPEGRRSMTPGKAMLYPSARMVDDAIRAIPDGQAISPRELRLILADQYGANYTCPVITTSMLRIVAEAANEACRDGASLTEVTPVWRVLGRKASALRKLSFGPGYLIDQRRREGLPA